MSTLRVHLHTCLEEKGGATRVAALVRQGLSREIRFSHSFEIADGPAEPAAKPVAPGAVARRVPKGAVLHVHGTRDWPALLRGLVAARRKGLPLVLTAHDAGLITGGCPYPLDCQAFFEGCPDPCLRGFPESSRQRAERVDLLFSLAPVIVSPSRWLARLLRPALPDLDIRVIPNGVPWPGVDRPEPRMPRAELRASLGLSPAARAVLFCAHGGEGAAYKAGERWRGYFEEVKSLEPRAVAFLVGGSEARQEGDVTVWPYLPQERLLELMRACDALAYPTHADNHPLVVLEAMSAGLPVVSFELGGLPEQVAPGRTGLLVPPGDHSGLAQAVSWLLHNDSLRRDMSHEALAHGRARFSVKRMARDHRKLYEALAAPRA
jgi:glycosyltransferase involved in cell wall biosynthesis